MLGDLDLTIKPQKPQLFLCRPNRQTIGKLNFAYNINLTVNLGKVNELTFDLPFKVDVHHNFQRETNVDNVRVQYLVKLVYNGLTDWFIIDKISETGDQNGDRKSIHAFSLAYQLINKPIRNYQADSQTATQQLTFALSQTTWKVGTVDPTFDAIYRGMNISSNTVLEVVYQIATTFSALVQFNSDTKTVDLLVPDNFGQDKGLNFKYGKYLKTVGNDVDTSNLITRIEAYGKDDITIGAVNPTGSSGIENLSFFLYPFERDANKNVITSSYYMSDGLCNAILDYEELCDSYTDQYKSLLIQLTNAETTLTAKQTDLTTLQNQLAIVNDNLDLQRSSNTLTIYNFTYNGSSVTKTTTLDSNNDYVVMMNASSVSNLTVQLDGTTKTLSSNTWRVLGKLSGKSSTSVSLSGSNSNSTISIYVLQISSDEYSASGNDSDLLNKYNDKYEQSLIDAKQIEVNSAQSDVNNVQSQINNIVDTLSLDKNFTTDQLDERDAFIITYEWSDTNYIDAQSLYDEAVKQLQQLQSPPIAITIDVVNFLEVVESQREWDKLVLGDKIRISYDMFNLDAKAQITNISYDFENSSIKLTIANIQEVKDDKKKFLDNIYSSISASKTVNMSQSTWDSALDANTKIDGFLQNAMDATKQEIKAGVNETVTINGRGITIKDSTNPNNIVVAQAGVIALSQDGGETWTTAIDPKGIYANTLMGKIILGEILQMQNSSGKMTFDDNGLTLTSTDNTKRILINETDGIKIQSSSDSGTTWADKLYMDSSGNVYAVNLNAKELIITDGSNNVLIDANTKTLDFSKFVSILGQISFNNASGGTLALGGVNNGNGVLTIYNSNGDTIAQFDSNNGGFNNLTVTNLTSNSVVSQNLDDITYTVSSGQIQQTLDSIPFFNQGNITINLTGDTNETLDVSGYCGQGTITIDLGGHTLNGSANIIGNLNKIYLQNGNINSSAPNVVYIKQSVGVEVGNLTINGNAISVNGVKIDTGASSYVHDCTINNVTYSGIEVAAGGIGTLDNNKGSGSMTHGIAVLGGFATGTGSTPSGSVSAVVTDSGGYAGNGWSTPTTGTTSTVGTAPTTTTWTSTGANDYSNSGYWDNSNQAKQGNYGYGRRTGLFFFDSSLSSTLSGKSISNMQVYLHRPSTGGTSGSVTIDIHTHNYSSTPSGSPTVDTSNTVTMSLPWGGSGWVTLPSSMYNQFSSGSAKGIGLYVASDSSSDYAVFNGGDCKVKATYS